MPRKLSFNTRRDIANAASGRVMIVLVTVTHMGEVVARLSSDWTQRLSADPLRYGTVSRGEEYEFLLMSAVVPSDQERTPMAATLEFENVTSDIATVIRSMTEPAEIKMELVEASSPDDVEDLWTGLKMISARVTGATVSIDVSRDPLTREAFPSHAMTRSRFPGLYR